MYDLIYNFLLNNLFNGTNAVTFDVNGTSLTSMEWLAHSCTMVTMVLFFAFFVFAVIWVFKFVGGLIGGIGR